MTNPLEPPKNPYGPKDRLNDKDLRGILTQAGFRGEGLNTAMTIARRESGWRPMAYNDNVKTGDNSYGLFQINMIGNLGKQRLGKTWKSSTGDTFKLKAPNDLFDPLTNARVAYHMTKGGKNWSSWSTSGNLPSANRVSNNAAGINNPASSHTTTNAGGVAPSTESNRSSNFFAPLTFGVK